MGASESDKTRGNSSVKITAAHLAGLRPRPAPASPLGACCRSTTFLAGFALAILAGPELTSIFNLGALQGAPHSATDLLVLLGVIGVFGIFPIVFIQHLYVQTTDPVRWKRFTSVVLALALMTFTTTAMKPLVGYEQKLAEDSRYAERHTTPAQIAGEASRSPASAPAEAIREGTELFR